MAKKKINLSITFALLLCSFALAGCAKQQVILFDYDAILKKAFVTDAESPGRTIPVVAEKSTEIDGTVAAVKDGNGIGYYLFYSSVKERGNFDIYLRSLSGVETVRVTKHPSKDFAPAISPDGRYLAFVSLPAAVPAAAQRMLPFLSIDDYSLPARKP